MIFVVVTLLILVVAVVVLLVVVVVISAALVIVVVVAVVVVIVTCVVVEVVVVVVVVEAHNSISSRCCHRQLVLLDTGEEIVAIPVDLPAKKTPVQNRMEIVPVSRFLNISLNGGILFNHQIQPPRYQAPPRK